jgi:single-strand DNA-binding protein
MGETYVTLWGNIATDPKGQTTPAGVRITNFRLACTASRRDPQTGAFIDGATSWYSVSCWRELAINAAASLTKGEPVVVYGRQVVREWASEDGKKGTDVSIDAVSVGHDLRRGQARFQRIKHGPLPGQEPPAGALADLPADASAAPDEADIVDPWADGSGDRRADPAELALS